MGRHSAPDDGGEDRSSVAVAPVGRPRPGRHSRPETSGKSARKKDVETQPEPVSAGIDLIEDALVAPPRPRPDGHDETAAPQAVTGEIPAQVDPTVDRAVPEAVTELIPVIEDDAGAEAPQQTVEAPDDAAEAPADVPATSEAAPEPPAKTKKPKGAQSTRSDLALIRTHADVRARCAAGLLVPFVLYVAALVVIGPLSLVRFLLWIWIPLITAGVLVGLFLDVGHRRYDASVAGPDDVSESSDRP